MSDHRRNTTGLFTGLFALLFLVIVGGGIAMYAAGWLTVASDEDSTSINVRTREIQDAASKAKEEGKQFLEGTGEALQDAGRELEDAGNDDEADDIETPAVPVDEGTP